MRMMRKGSRIAAILAASLMLSAWMPSFVYAQPNDSGTDEYTPMNNLDGSEDEKTKTPEKTEDTDHDEDGIMFLSNEPETIGTSGDAYILYDETAQSWTFGTAQVEKTVQFVGDNAKKISDDQLY